MAANRKLQTEIQQVLKKMDEGIVLFDEIWEKVYTADTQPLKEKFEADLKKEIKKLQRLRDQIKTWIGSNEIKDKTALVEARKTIEGKMEQFKVCERDTKTKAYSKEGLARDAKLDPKEAVREEKRNWLNECLDNINDLNNTVEAEKEKLSSGKGKSKNKDELMRLENRLQKQKWHIAKLELIIKLIDNEELDPASLDNIKDSVEYYIETAQDDDGQLGVEHEFDIYEDLALDSFSVGPATFDLPRSTTQDDGSPIPGPVAAPTSAAAPGLTPPVTTITTPGTNSTVAVTSKTTTIIEHKAPLKEAAPKESLTDATAGATEKRTGPAPSVAQIVKGGSKPAAPEVTATSTPPPPGIVPVAGAKSTISDASDSKSSKPASESSPRPNAKAEPAPAKATVPAAKPTAPAKTTAPAATAAISSPAPPVTTAPATANSKTTTVPSAQPPAANTTSAPSTASNTPASTAPQATPVANTSAQSTPALTATNATSTTGPPAGLTPNLTGALPPPTANSSTLLQQQQQQQQQLLQQQQLQQQQLQQTAAVAPAPAMSLTPEQLQTIALLKQSAMYMPEEFQYIPRTPNPLSHPAFPSTPICTNHSEYAALFEKLPLDTMFFAFYHQQNSFQQTLAAKRLKKNSWRYHKKYVTWFQRHSEPKMATQDYEEGTYLYFDYDGGWNQRIKADFKFEYAFLEDELN